jgi:diaminopimelate epimerase
VATLQYLAVEGIGNDFLLVDRLDGLDELELERLGDAAPRLCDRATGVGADGLLIVGPARTHGAAAEMLVINHDGSRPEMCGNGLRCVAHFVSNRNESDAPILIDTGAGALRCEVLEGLGDERAQVAVDMGPARRLGLTTPESGDGRSFAGVSMGNPHAIAFVDAGESPESLASSLGPSIEVDPAYPNRTNVEFARVESDHSITLWVWERGCGITLACGTGACATAAAAVDAGLIAPDTWIPVRLPGGELAIRVPSDPGASVQMRGASHHVGRGSVAL